MHKTSVYVAVALVALTNACAVSDSQPTDATDAGVPATREGTTMDEPELTIELAPTTTRKTSVAVPDSDTGAPRGFDTALFSEVDPGLAPFVERSIVDLAALLEVADTDIRVRSATLVTWPNSALGCPLPDMQYMQALQDGSLIELEHAGTVYRYHSGGDRVPFLCDAGLAVPPASGGTADS